MTVPVYPVDGPDHAAPYPSRPSRRSRAGVVVSIFATAAVALTLGASDAVISRMSATRALDGMQDGQWEGISASWTYHPDDGLNITLTMN